MTEHGMTIGINTLFCIPNQVGGTEYHLRSTLQALEKVDKKNSYIIFCNKENFHTFTFHNSVWKKVLCPIHASFRPLRIIYEQFILPFLIKNYHCDILHSFGYFGPIFCPAKHVVTIHDCNWRDCPEDFSLFERIVLTFLIEQNIKTANTIITDSEFSKTRLLHYFPSIMKRLMVVSPRLSCDFIHESKTKHANPLEGKPYFLCVSGFYPHKNIPYLLTLWRSVMQKEKDLHLVLIGKNGHDQKKVLSMISNLRRIHFFPHVSFERLLSFYQHAKAFIIPSIYEGFSYPAYEASMFCLPIFVGNISCFQVEIQPRLHALTFNLLKDCENVMEQTKKVRLRKRNKVLYVASQKSLEELLNIYMKLPEKNY